MTKQEIFTAAHKLARTFEGNYNACFKLALISIYESLKSSVIKETEKALLVMATMISRKQVQIDRWTRKWQDVEETTEIWIPKSQISEGKVSRWFISQNNASSIKF